MYQGSNGNPEASFGDASSYEVLDCPAGMQFGFGRMFMFYNFVTLKLTKQNGDKIVGQVSINNYKSRPKIGEKNVTVVVILGVVSILIIVLFIMI